MIDLEPLKRLRAEATDADWAVESYPTSPPRFGQIVARFGVHSIFEGDKAMANANLVVALRNNMDAMIAEIEALRATVSWQQEAYQQGFYDPRFTWVAKESTDGSEFKLALTESYGDDV